MKVPITGSARLPLAPLFALMLHLAGCTLVPAAAPAPTPRGPTESEPHRALTPAPNVPGDPTNGRRLFVAAGCAGCHTLQGLPATGVAGPNLTNVVLRPTLAGEMIPMTPESLTRFLLEPAALKPGSPMPNVGLTEPEARDLAAFLYSQPHNPAE
jgi:cytochrome c1